MGYTAVEISKPGEISQPINTIVLTLCHRGVDSIPMLVLEAIITGDGLH